MKWWHLYLQITKKKLSQFDLTRKKKREMKPDNFLLIVNKAYKSKISFWFHEKCVSKISRILPYSKSHAMAVWREFWIFNDFSVKIKHLAKNIRKIEIATLFGTKLKVRLNFKTKVIKCILKWPTLQSDLANIFPKN